MAPTSCGPCEIRRSLESRQVASDHASCRAGPQRGRAGCANAGCMVVQASSSSTTNRFDRRRMRMCMDCLCMRVRPGRYGPCPDCRPRPVGVAPCGVRIRLGPVGGSWHPFALELRQQSRHQSNIAAARFLPNDSVTQPSQAQRMSDRDVSPRNDAATHRPPTRRS